MAADSIRTMKLDQALILCGHHRPIFAKMYPYYENATYRKYASMPTPALNSQIPFTTIPTIILENDDDDYDE
jgi:type IV secretory pathway TraG/TraD family ATPase VirD4